MSPRRDGDELYVYYRVDARDAAAAARALDTVQQALRRDVPGLVARRLRRCEGVDGPQTWMETYALPGRGLDAELQARIADAAQVMSGWTIGDRHVEVFAPFEPIEPPGG